MNGFIDGAAMFPPLDRHIKQPIYIMWSRMGGKIEGHEWRPNHFVPLLHDDRKNGPTICLDDDSPPTQR